MDIQEFLSNQVAAQRQKVLQESPQLTLGELLLWLENLKDKKKKVFFNFDDAYPLDLQSWRGSYAEICFDYESGGTAPTVEQVITEVESAIGKTFHGYKGGDFRMGRHTPVWVAHYGQSNDTGIVGVKEEDEKVILQTAKCEL